ncbi:MAG: type II secretion system GspH family protein [Lentisphaerales bacterium]|nr:type II secretion system GspH family protein [Lentisphaerales bacterium]
MKTKKFSMIEVMAVVAVMSTLSVMLITSVKTSKDVAIQATCMSNIAQIRNVTELHRKDNGKLPYSEIWMTDFSFAKDYISEGSALNIFTCPGSEDYEVTQYSQLTHNTSYYYIPNGRLLAQNINDGSNYGITADQVDKLIASQNGIIYDKSPDHHNGKVNIAYLYKDDENQGEFEGKQGSIASLGDNDNLLDLDGANLVNLPTLADNNDPVAEDNNEPVAEEEPQLADDEEVDFDINDDEIVVNEDVIATYKVLGAAISYGGQYDMAVTTQFQVTDADGNTNTDAGFGEYDSVSNGNVNDGEQHEYTPEEIYTAGSIITTEATSWKKTSTSKSGNNDKHWREYMEVDSSNNTNAKALIHGDEVPNIDGYLDQGNVESFLENYINDGGTINLADNQIIILFELGTTNMNSSAADFQDLVILVTLVRAPEGTEEESLSDVVADYDDGKSNNGHGNNVDGVDSSNPGKAPFVDSVPTVDDEQGNGNSVTSSSSDSNSSTSTNSNDSSSSSSNSGNCNSNSHSSSKKQPWWMKYFR